MKSRRITALFTLLAILIAPLCAPFCHSHTCAALPSDHNDGCHSPAVSSDNIRHLAIAAFHVCGGQELPTAVLNEATKSLEISEQQFASHASVNLVASQFAPLGVRHSPPPHSDPESPIESISIRPSVLRI